MTEGETARMVGAPVHQCLVSVLLDTADDGPFKAEILIRSLIERASLVPRQVIVHCVPELDDSIVVPLRQIGCRVNVLGPAPGAADNDLARQLDALRDIAPDDLAGVWLCSLGTAFVGPLPTVGGGAVAGLPADDPSLPLEVVQRFFRALEVALPVATPLDTSILYVPRASMDSLCAALRRFACAVVANDDLVGERAGARGVAELSLALALGELKFPIEYLTANDGFPLQALELPPSYDAQRPLHALRCEGSFDTFGLVAPRLHEPRVDAAVAALNSLIAQPSQSPYFKCYKRALARSAPLPELAADHPFVVAARSWASRSARRIKLVLHAGIPKTGTTALQDALYRHVDMLLEHGVWYPPARLDPVLKKHQYLIDPLVRADAEDLVEAFDEIVRSIPAHAHTVVISTEGLYNHWWDFPRESKAMLRRLTTTFDVEIWCCFREPLGFAITVHAERLRNPRGFSPAYGLDAGLDEMLDLPWFRQRLDFLGFVYEIEHEFGRGSLRAFEYGPEIVQRFFRALGAAEPAMPAHRAHPSLRRPGVDLMRIVNRYALPADEQAAAAVLVLELDTLIGERAEPLRASAAAERRIRQLADRGWRVVETDFQRVETFGTAR